MARSLLAPAMLLAATALAGCGSEAPAPYETQGQTRAPVDDAQVRLRGDGLAAGADAFYFSAGRREVETALARRLGEAEARGRDPECGAGPIDYTRFPGGLTVNFTGGGESGDGTLAGWFWRKKESATPPIGVAGPVTLGMDGATLRGVQGYRALETGTLGQEFTMSNSGSDSGAGSLGGFVEDGRVAALYAGTNCFAR